MRNGAPMYDSLPLPHTLTAFLKEYIAFTIQSVLKCATQTVKILLKWSELNFWIFPMLVSFKSLWRAAGATHSRNLLNSALAMLIFLNAKLWNEHSLMLYAKMFVLYVIRICMHEFMRIQIQPSV